MQGQLDNGVQADRLLAPDALRLHQEPPDRSGCAGYGAGIHDRQRGVCAVLQSVGGRGVGGVLLPQDPGQAPGICRAGRVG